SRLSSSGVSNTSISIFFGWRVPPRAAVAFHQVFGIIGTKRTGFVIWKISRRNRIPNVEHRRHDRPARLDHIGALEERRVADHTIVKQPFVTRAYLFAE